MRWQAMCHGSKQCCRAISKLRQNRSRMESFLSVAIEEAKRGRAEGGIPIGSAIVHRGRIIGRGHNRRVQQGSGILHGEMDAVERTGRQQGTVYRGCVGSRTLFAGAM